MPLSDLDVFNDEVYVNTRELLAYNVDLFNAKTNGGLVLTTGMFRGDFFTESRFDRLSGLIRRRDVYATGAVSAIDFGMSNRSKVKVGAGTPPVNIDPNMMSWIGKDPAAAAAMYSTQLAEEMLLDQINAEVNALIAAMTNVGATMTYDGTGGTATQTGLVNGKMLLGDRSGEIKCWVMNSATYFALLKAGLANAANLFTFGNVNVMVDATGTPFVVTDLPALVYTSTGTKYHVLGLTPGAAVVEGSNDFVSNVVTVNGQNNILRTVQSEWTYNLSLKGFTWDTTNGGKSPTDAELATGTNWDYNFASVKDGPGVLVNFA
jgi:hypothetical protein